MTATMTTRKITVMAPESVETVLTTEKTEELHAYCAGPMTNYKAFNFPAFIEADGWLSEIGFTDTYNPAVHELESGVVDYDDIMGREGSLADLAEMNFSKRKALKRDMWAIADADNVFLLPGWRRSSGAVLEVTAAMWAGVPCWEIDMEADTFWAVTSIHEEPDLDEYGLLQVIEVAA